MLTLLPDTDPILRQVAQPVTVFDPSLRILVADMAETMEANRGVGLAAPQVGISTRVILANVEGIEFGVLVNPEIVEAEGEFKFKEGCLTFPKLFLEVKRAQKVVVKYQDLRGEHHVVTLQNFAAVVVQHEIDHLNGKLFIDRVPPMQLALARKNLKNR